MGREHIGHSSKYACRGVRTNKDNSFLSEGTLVVEVILITIFKMKFNINGEINYIVIILYIDQ